MGQKAAASGVAVVFVDPRFTSQQCRMCGHTAPENRESQAVFRCRQCGHADHADANAARNILARGLLTTGEAVPADARGHGHHARARPRKRQREPPGRRREPPGNPRLQAGEDVNEHLHRAASHPRGTSTRD
ncbi:MAG TPA: zinc ribbon domain-containing protein [Trebonia sp.]